MKASFKYPSESTLKAFLIEKQAAFYNYKEKNGTKTKKVPGYDNDLNTIYIGEGEIAWHKAKEALQTWQQFPPPWTRIYKDNTSIQEGNTVAVLFQLFGIWWINAARIVYAFDETDRFGFAYGTLHGHVESGEECFWIDRDESGNIYYHIKAFSKPAFWGAKLAYPIARRYQRKFVRESMERMKELVNR
ncbi:MAG: hypothetical protein ACI8X3_003483 [Saprospiraceae bacterium]|jgi:uncharacterized protein (UPF0548 family)